MSNLALRVWTVNGRRWKQADVHSSLECSVCRFGARRWAMIFADRGTVGAFRFRVVRHRQVAMHDGGLLTHRAADDDVTMVYGEQFRAHEGVVALGANEYGFAHYHPSFDEWCVRRGRSREWVVKSPCHLCTCVLHMPNRCRDRESRRIRCRRPGDISQPVDPRPNRGRS